MLSAGEHRIGALYGVIFHERQSLGCARRFCPGRNAAIQRRTVEDVGSDAAYTLHPP